MSPGSTASPGSPATWRSAAWSTPAPTRPRSAALLDRLALPGWDLRFEEGLRGGIACTRAVVGGDDGVVTVTRTYAAIAALIREAALPTAVTERARWPSSARWPASRRPCTAPPSSRSTSTRSVATTPSSTSSGRPPPSRCSVSTRCARRRWPPAPAWCAARTGCCPTRPRPRFACSRASPPTDATCPWSSPPRPAPRSSGRSCSAFGPLPRHAGQRRRGSGAARPSSTTCPTAPRWSSGDACDSRGPRGRAAGGRARDQPRRRHRRAAGHAVAAPSKPERSTPGSARWS